MNKNYLNSIFLSQMYKQDVSLHNQNAVLNVLKAIFFIFFISDDQSIFKRSNSLLNLMEGLFKTKFNINKFVDFRCLPLFLLFFFIFFQKNVHETQTLLENLSDPDDMLKELQVRLYTIYFDSDSIQKLHFLFSTEYS